MFKNIIFDLHLSAFFKGVKCDFQPSYLNKGDLIFMQAFSYVGKKVYLYLFHTKYGSNLLTYLLT